MFTPTCRMNIARTSIEKTLPGAAYTINAGKSWSASQAKASVFVMTYALRCHPVWPGPPRPAALSTMAETARRC